jgi:hypothetical protein
MLCCYCCCCPSWLPLAFPAVLSAPPSLPPGLGLLSPLPDELLLELLYGLPAADLARLGLASKACYCFAHTGELWKALVIQVGQVPLLLLHTLPAQPKQPKNSQSSQRAAKAAAHTGCTASRHEFGNGGVACHAEVVA